MTSNFEHRYTVTNRIKMYIRHVLHKSLIDVKGSEIDSTNPLQTYLYQDWYESNIDHS